MVNNRLPIEKLKKTSLLRPDDLGNERPKPRRRFSEEAMTELMQGFAKRLKFAFNDAPNSEIARALLTDDSTIKQYTDAKRLPPAEIIILISMKTGINIHWLLSGIGERRVKSGDMFNDDEERKINYMAKESGRSFDEMVNVLTMTMIEANEKI